MTETVITIGAGISLGALGIWSLIWARSAGTRHAPHPAVSSAFRPITDGSRWLRCDTTSCAHMTTRHIPRASGAYECTACLHVREAAGE